MFQASLDMVVLRAAISPCKKTKRSLCVCFVCFLFPFLFKSYICSYFKQDCDDTILLERIIGRGSAPKGELQREDDNFQTAIRRLRTFHQYHYKTMEWLREQHVPIVNLDCSGTPDSVWQQLKAIGRLMRPAVKLPGEIKSLSEAKKEKVA